MDILPLSQFADNGFRGAVVDYTCDDEKTATVDGVSLTFALKGNVYYKCNDYTKNAYTLFIVRLRAT